MTAARPSMPAPKQPWLACSVHRERTRIPVTEEWLRRCTSSYVQVPATGCLHARPRHQGSGFPKVAPIPHFAKIFSAQFKPSMAEEVIPPAYPDPSPHGYRPGTWGCSPLSAKRGIRTGDEVRLSNPNSTASSVKNDFFFFETCTKAPRKASAMKEGSNWSMRAGYIPIG